MPVRFRPRAQKMHLFFLNGFVLLSLLVTSCAGTKGFTLAKSKESDFNSCLALSKKKKHDEAIQCLEAYRSRHTGSAIAAEADLAIADSYFAQKDFIVAAEAYNIFTESYPYHARAPYAYFQAGLSYLKQAPRTVDRDQNVLDDAMQNFMAVVNSYAGSPYAVDAKKYLDLVHLKTAKKNFYIGRFYFKTREFLAAIPRFETVITDYPKLGLDDKSFYYLIKALKKTEQSEMAARYFEIYKRYYPDRMKTIKKMAALF